ncbi:MAG TPA: nucleoside hydrolase [Gemmataceae bacterium]|nr:nucleoside hydrolase [Gemmataceae bacterium]
MRKLIYTACVAIFVVDCSIASDRRPVLIDTDIGGDIDDAFALALAVASPEIELVGVTTVGKGDKRDPYVRYISTDRDEDRAWLVCRFLTQVGLKDIPVAAGAEPQPKLPIDWQIQYRRHPAAVYNRTLKPVKESAVELMTKLAKARDDLTIVALGPLTNVTRFIKEQPEAAKRVKELIIMGGSIAVGYDGKPKPEPEWNFKTDIAAAKAVLASGLRITLVPLDATANVKLDKQQRERLFSARTPLTYQLQNLYELWDKETPILFDPVAVRVVFGHKMLIGKRMGISVDDAGMTIADENKSDIRVMIGSKADELVEWYVDRVRNFGKESLPKPPGNRTRLIEPGSFPTRVHAFEDYETDIEKRWWMCGKLETKKVPVPSGRACRAVLTQDFDDKQGQLDTMYRAVIFNPVPGPPMGPNTRLRFRYKLTGTDTLRVQLYTLTNGYHRYLSVSGLEQGKWAEGAVDMTKMRRPDGTGGSLATDERIDDIQFYVDPRAELLIDDVILYDAAVEGEKRPFPKRAIFTGWFDTGKQGVEWPGEFEIVPHEKPRTWKAARSIARPAPRDPWLRIGLRGARELPPTVEINFKYHLIGAHTATVEFWDAKAGRVRTLEWKPEKTGEWAETTIALPGSAATVDELRFTLPKGGQLTVDDVLVYEPAQK